MRNAEDMEELVKALQKLASGRFCESVVIESPKENPVKEDQQWLLLLNKYQRDNLAWLFAALGVGKDVDGHQGGVMPFNGAANGDWVTEIAHLLSTPEQRSAKDTTVLEPGDRPNSSLNDLEEEVRCWVQTTPAVTTLRNTLLEAIKLIPENEWAVFLARLSVTQQQTVVQMKTLQEWQNAAELQGET